MKQAAIIVLLFVCSVAATADTLKGVVHDLRDARPSDGHTRQHHQNYVRGSTIDYEENLQGAGFKVSNPNVVAACGCGSSFRVAEEEQVSAV